MNFNYNDVLKKGVYINGNINIVEETSVEFIEIIEDMINVKFNTGDEFDYLLYSPSVDLIYIYILDKYIIFSDNKHRDPFFYFDLRRTIKEDYEKLNVFIKNSINNDRDLSNCIQVFKYDM